MLNVQAQRSFLFLLLFAIAALSIGNVVGFFLDLRDGRRGEQAAVELRRLNLITLGITRRGVAPRPELVARLVKDAELQRDPWGTEYRMESGGGKLAWRSAGRDRRWGTIDDISLELAKVAAQVPNRELADEIKVLKGGAATTNGR